MPLLHFADVSKSYRPGGPPALDHVTTSVAEGELVALLGPSGAGKSTFIRCVNGLVRPDSGQVLMEGTDVGAADARALRDIRRKVGMVFQEFALVERLSVLTNVISGRFGQHGFWRNALGLWPPSDRTAARRLIERVGLCGLVNAPVRELSGGQRQRVAVARAMMQEPCLLLGDEPVSSLDHVTARGVLGLMTDLSAEQGLTTVLSLHDVALAREFCRRAVGLRAGRIVYDGPMEGVTETVLREVYAGAPAGVFQRSLAAAEG